jgi:hypothetical protein
MSRGHPGSARPLVISRDEIEEFEVSHIPPPEHTAEAELPRIGFRQRSEQSSGQLRHLQRVLDELRHYLLLVGDQAEAVEAQWSIRAGGQALFDQRLCSR